MINDNFLRRSSGIRERSHLRVWGCRALLFSFVVFHLAMSIACSEAKEHIAPAIDPRDSVAMMTSYGVNTLISDSGVIKYRIVTERWEVNTTRQPSRWEFMKGIFFEQFDEKFHVQAYIQADTAWYFDQQNLWKLRGRVSFRNIDGVVYTGEELYWDGRQHELYSNVYSRLVTPDRTIEGTCFRSDETMTRYSVTNSKGSFIKDDAEREQNEAAPADEVLQDTTAVQPAIRPASQRHKAGKN